MTFDSANYVQGSVSGGNGTKTMDLTNLTVGAGTNRILFCTVTLAWNGGSDVSGVTWNGTAMTLIGSTSYYQTGDTRTWGWYLLNPASGTNTLTVTGTGYNTANGNGYCIGAASYAGSLQSGQLDDGGSPAISSGVGSTHTMSVTTSKSGSWGIVLGGGVNSGMTANSVITTDRVAPGSGSYQPYIGDTNGGMATGAHSLVVNGSGVWGQGWIGTAFKDDVTTAIKTVNGLAYASVKTFDGLAVASVKNINGLA